MSKQDQTAEQLNDLLDEPLSPPELASATGTAASEAGTALEVRQALKDLQPDSEFVAQLEARLLASINHAEIATRSVAPLAWLRRVAVARTDMQIASPRQRRLVLVLTGITSLLVSAFAAVILIPLLGGKEPTPHGLGSPVWNPSGVNGGLSVCALTRAPFQLLAANVGRRYNTPRCGPGQVSWPARPVYGDGDGRSIHNVHSDRWHAHGQCARGCDQLRR